MNKQRTPILSWTVQCPTELDMWLKAAAQEEHIHTSTLIRKAVIEYLGTHHRNLQPA